MSRGAHLPGAYDEHRGPSLTLKLNLIARVWHGVEGVKALCKIS